MRIVTLCFLGGLGVALAACSTPVDSSPSPVFGQAAASLRTQIIPASVSALAPQSAGVQGSAAIARYERGEQKKLEVESTSNINNSASPYAGK